MACPGRSGVSGRPLEGQTASSCDPFECDVTAFSPNTGTKIATVFAQYQNTSQVYHESKGLSIIDIMYISPAFVSVCPNARGKHSSRDNQNTSLILSMGLYGTGSNPGGGEIFRARPDRPWGPPSLLYNEYWVSSPGVKR